MKKQILSITLGFVMMSIGTTTYALDKNSHSHAKLTADEKVVKDCNKKFESAGNSIIHSSKNGFIVSSFADGHEITSAYDKKGKSVYTITHYATDNLAKNIMNIVRSNYDSYFISGMEKVEQPGNESVFIVHIKNKDSFKTLRVVNNEVELVEDFKKG